MTRTFIAAVAAIVFLSCATSNRSVETYLAAHPDKSTAIRTAIRNGYLVGGMTREDVIAVRGTPDEQEATDTDDVKAHVLIYYDHQIEERVILENGVLIKVEQRGTPTRTGFQFRF